MNRTSLLVLLLASAACGTVDTGEPPDPVVDHTPDGGPTGSPDPVPNVAPTVLAVDPPAGSVVDEDVALIITFSEPMDHTSVEAALSFPGSTPPGFEWNQDGNQVTASRRVAYPEGADPAQVEPRSFDILLAAGASDLDGEPLGEELVVDYTLHYRRITTAFPFSQTLSGNCFLPCSGTWSWVVAGENSSDTTVTNRGFLTVPFVLPADITVEAASIETAIEAMTGDPFGELGDLIVDDVTFSAITDQSLYGRGKALGSLYLAADHPGPGVTATFDVTAAFADDYAYRAERSYRTQFRIRFLHDSPEDPTYDSYHSDGKQDVVRLLRDATSLSVTYLIP